MAMEQNTLKRRGVGLTGVDKQKSFGGYTLFCPLTSDSAHLVDIDGNEVHSWKLPGRVGRHARILPNGNLAVNTLRPPVKETTADGGPFPFPFFNKYGGGIMSELDPDGNVVRQFTDPLGHHDQYHHGDGRILYTALEALSREESAKVLGGVPGSEIDGITYADTIREVDAAGELTWEWKVSERLPRAEFPLQAHYTREHYPLINSVLPLRDGNVLASLRSVSAVIIIERATGAILWRLGPEVLAQQHNATELANGNILIFDNGAFRGGESVTYTRAIEVDRATKRIVWEYRDRSQMVNFFTPFMGSAQRLANGNTLLCESAFGRLFEVTRDGHICWEYVNPHFAPYPDQVTAGIFLGESNALFRAYRYSLDEVPWLKQKLSSSQGNKAGCVVM